MNKHPWDDQYDDPLRYRTWPSEDLVRFLSGAFGPEPLEPGRRALDLGCGAGGNLWTLLWWGFEAYGIDPSPVARMLAAKTILERTGRAISPVYYGEATAIPFPMQFFDVVVDAMTLQHVVDLGARMQAMAECARVLVPGGRLLSIHLLGGTDFEEVFPGVPSAWLPEPEDLEAEWNRAGLVVKRHVTTARSLVISGLHAAYSVLHLAKASPG